MHKRKIEEQNTRNSLTLASTANLNSGFILDQHHNL
jgi:hypothetical protein